MGFIENVNALAKNSKLLNEIDTKLTKVEDNIDNIKFVERNVRAIAEDMKNLSIQKNKIATDSEYGIVRLATEQDLLSGIQGKVVTSEHFIKQLDKKFRDRDVATDRNYGVVKLATDEEYRTLTGNGVITPNMIRKNKLPLDMTDFYATGTLKNGLSYIITTIDKDRSEYLQIFGKVDFYEDHDTIITFPQEIFFESIGLSVVPFQTVGFPVIQSLDNNSVALRLYNNDNVAIEASGYINISSLLKSSVTISRPNTVKATSYSDDVTITWG